MAYGAAAKKASDPLRQAPAKQAVSRRSVQYATTWPSAVAAMLE
jgi:hypothetical protein